MKHIAHSTFIFMAIAVLIIVVGIVGAIAHALGGWFWVIGGGIILLVAAVVIGVSVTVIRDGK